MAAQYRVLNLKLNCIIYIVGYNPSWITNFTHLYWHQTERHELRIFNPPSNIIDYKIMHFLCNIIRQIDNQYKPYM